MPPKCYNSILLGIITLETRPQRPQGAQAQEDNMMQFGQISGMIFGATAGDCLGSPYVFMRSKDLFAQASQICWQIAPAGGISQMMLAMLSAVCRHGLNTERLAKAYQAWVHQGRHETDFITASAFGHDRYLSPDELTRNARHADYGAICGGQLLIRQIPIVLAALRLPVHTLCRHIETDTRLTHTDEDTIRYAQLYAQCLHGSLNGCSRCEIWDQLFKQANTPCIYKTLLSSYYEKPTCDDRDYSHAKITLGIALYHFWHNTPFVSAMRSTVLAGGATDINAAAVGALLGATQGINAIPAAWRACLLEADDSEHLRHSIIKAERLVAIRSYDIDRPSRRVLPPSRHTLTSSADKQNK